MSIRQTLVMAFKSIAGNKLRSFLTMLGIIIGVAAVISLVSVTQAQMNIYVAQMSAMGVNRIDMYMDSSANSSAREKIIQYCEDAIGTELEAMSPTSSTSLVLKYRTKTMDNTRTYFGNEQYAKCVSSAIASGRNLTKSDIQNRSRVCVIGEAVSKNFFGAMSPIGQYIKIGDNWSQNYQSYKVVGVFEGKYRGQLNTDDQMILVPYTLQYRLTGWEDDSSYVLSAMDGKSSIDFTEKLTAYANELIPPDPRGWQRFYAYSNQQGQEQMQGYANQNSIMMGGIAGISLLVGGIGIMNIMLVSVTERTREIGIRMAIGARRRDIIGQFLIESAVVSACGGIIGILFGYFGSEMLGAAMVGPMMNQPGMAEVEISVGPSIPIVIGAFLFSVLLGIVFGLYPANKASKMQPVDALRTQ